MIFLRQEEKRLLREELVRSYDPLSHQRNFHTSLANERLAIGSNRSGKTTCGVVEDLWWATNKHPYLDTPASPVYIRCVCTDFVNGIQKTILPKFREYIKHTDLQGSSWSAAYSKEFRTLHFDPRRFGDTFVEFMSYDQDVEKFGGPPRHLIHYDEPPPYDIYMECQARLVDFGGKSFCTFTPINLDARTSWIYKLWKEADAGVNPDLASFFFDIDQNKYLPKDYVEDFKRRIRGEAEYLARIKGTFPRLAGRIYPDFGKPHIKKPFKIPEDWSIYISADPHTRKETAVIVAVVDREGVVYITHEIFIKAKAKVILAMIRQALGRRPLQAAFMDDQARAPNTFLDGKSIWQEFLDPDRDGSNNGIYFIPVSGRQKDVIPGIRKVNDYLGLDQTYNKPRLYVFNTCVKTIDQLESYIWEDYKNKIDAPVLEKPHKVEEDLCDVTRYLLMGQPVYVKPRLRDDAGYVHPYGYTNPYAMGGER